jgi:uncharacterized protein YbjQ (UPF0145 family)
VRIVIVECLLVAGVGCATIQPTPAARGVRIVQEQSFVATCRFIDEVKGGQYAPVVGAVEHTIDHARTRIREDAAQKGANVVLITERTANVYGTWMHGEAYACPGQ